MLESRSRGTWAKAIVDRLRREDGASLLYALMFMLVGIMVSVTTLAAAVTAVNRLHDDQEWKQERLTLDSAGSVLKGMICETSLTVRTTKGSGIASAEVIDKSGPLADILEPAVVATAQDHMGVLPGGDSFDIEVEGFPTAHVSYEMTSEEVDMITGETHPQDRYRIVASVTLDEGEQALFVEAYQSNEAEVVQGGTPEAPVLTETVHWDDVTVGTTAPAIGD